MPNWKIPAQNLEEWGENEKQGAKSKTGMDATAQNIAGDFAKGVGGVFDFIAGNPSQVSLYNPDQNAYKVNGYSTQGFNQQANAAAQRQNAGNNQNRDAQTALLQQLQQQAQGQGSAATQMYGKMAAQNNADTMRAAAASRGAQQGAQIKNANMSMAQGNLQNNANMNMMKLQDQRNAQQMMGQLSGQMRGQDLQFQGMNDDLVKFYTQSGLSLAQSQQQAAAALEKLRMEQQLEIEKQRLTANGQSNDFAGNAFNTITQLF